MFVLTGFTGITPGFAGMFNDNTNMINPAAVNNAGMPGVTSLINGLADSVGEIGISTFASTNYYLYSGNLQIISYPNCITTLSALPGTNEREITLQWISPDVDESTGTCSGYDIRYSTDLNNAPSVSEQKFQSCNSVSVFSPVPVPEIAGSIQSLIITGLTQKTTYFFAVKTRDVNYSWSFLSNGTSSYAKFPPDIPGNPAQCDLSGEPINWGNWINYRQLMTSFTLSGFFVPVH